MESYKPIFLFGFLPVLMALHAACPRHWRNRLLLAASLFFYFWGGRQHLFLLVALCAAHWPLGRWVSAGAGTRAGQWRLGIAVGLDLAVLGVCKYAGFLLEQLDPLWVALGQSPLPRPTWHLPLGISFFVFEGIAYLIDIHRRESAAADAPTYLGLYLTFFPHLVAGPIVRYRELAGQFAERTISIATFADGVRRFIIGLAKKVLLADSLFLTAKVVFGQSPEQLSAGAAWLGLIAYGLQLFFDFSGYSDMAVGLAKLFGFTLPENFDRPYSAQSLGEFWRRWHITLSGWLRDYVYLPLGGSRRGPVRMAINLLAVFLLCGLWHGAGWTFIVWGLWHGLFSVLERCGWSTTLGKLPRLIRHAYLLAVVFFGWVFFRAPDLGQALGFFRALAGWNGGRIESADLWNWQLALALLAGVAVCACPTGTIRDWRLVRPIPRWAGTAALLTLFAAAVVEAVSGSDNPFIYGRF